MKKKTLAILWVGYYIFCAALSAIPAPQGALFGLMVLVGLGFFVPGSLLLYQCVKTQDRKALILIRNISVLSLALTVILLLLSFASAIAPEWVGELLYVLLVAVSVPMICCRVWILSLFGWAVMLMVSIHCLKKGKDGA